MKKLLLLLLTIAITLNIVACGNEVTQSSNEATQSSNEAQESRPVKIIMRNVNNGGAEAIDNQEVYDYIAKLSGIDFEVVNMPNEAELAKKINLSLAGQEEVDAIQTSFQTCPMVDLKNRGALMPLKDLIEEHAPKLKAAFTEDQWKAVSDPDGEIWAVPRLQEAMGYAVVIRKDWREKLGIEKAPTTIEEFEDYLRKVKDADLNGNGQKDTVPLLCFKGFKEIEGALGYSMLGVPILNARTPYANYIDEKGNVVPIALHPRYKGYIEKIAQWYQEGLIHPDQYVMKKDQANDLVMANRLASHAGWYSRVIRPWEKLLVNDPNAEYEYITLKTFDGQDYKVTRPYESNPGLSIPSYSDNVVNTLKLLEWMVSSPENYIITRYGIPGKHWEWVDKEKLIVKDLRGGEGVYDHAYQLMYYANFFPEMSGRTDFVTEHYAKAQKFLGEQGFVWRPDYNLFYDIKGTPMENTKADADSYLEESITSIILGETSIDEWDNIMAYYKKLYADDFTKYATELYKNQK